MKNRIKWGNTQREEHEEKCATHDQMHRRIPEIPPIQWAFQQEENSDGPLRQGIRVLFWKMTKPDDINRRLTANAVILQRIVQINLNLIDVLQGELGRVSGSRDWGRGRDCPFLHRLSGSDGFWQCAIDQTLRKQLVGHFQPCRETHRYFKCLHRLWEGRNLGGLTSRKHKEIIVAPLYQCRGSHGC